MEKLRIKESFFYLFKCENWFVMILAIIGLFFIPIIGWFAIAGYYLRITRFWIHEDYYRLPDFSDFWELVERGFFMFVLGLILALPLFILLVIICIGWILMPFYSLFLFMITPYTSAKIALCKSFSDILDFDEIKRFVKDNVVNVLIFMGITMGMSFVINILIAPLNLVGNIFTQMGGDSFSTILPALIFYGISITISSIMSIYIGTVMGALAGNIYGIWLRKQETIPGANTGIDSPPETVYTSKIED